MAFGLSAALDYAVPMVSDRDCCVHLLQAEQGGGCPSGDAAAKF